MRLKKTKDEHKQLATFIMGGTLSYIKFSKEVTKWLKANELPYYGAAYDSPEVIQTRLDALIHRSKMMAQKWISEKRYQGLISCAHGGWYQDDVMVKSIHLV